MVKFFNKRFYFLKLAVSEFHFHRKRFSLTALGIAWGTCTILLLLAFGEGLKLDLEEKKYSIGDNVIIMWGGWTTIPYNGMPKGRMIQFGPDDIEYIKENVTEIGKISGAYRSRRIDANAGRNEGSIDIYGVNPDYGRSRNLVPKIGGRFLNTDDMVYKRRVIFMGWDVLKKFYPEGKAVGKTIIINQVPFTIVGVLKQRMQAASFGSQDKDKGYIPAATYSTLFGETYFNHVLFSVANPAEAEYAKRKLYYLMGKKYNFDPKDTGAIRMWETVEMIERMGKLSISMQILMGIIGSLTLLISGVGLANIMYASISKRTKEIGIKIAIGAHPRQVLLQIVTEAFFFSVVGGLLGGGIAILVSEALVLIPIENEALAFLKSPRLSLHVGIITTIALTGITFIAGFFPARRAAMQNPIESLRYE